MTGAVNTLSKETGHSLKEFQYVFISILQRAVVLDRRGAGRLVNREDIGNTSTVELTVIQVGIITLDWLDHTS